MKIKIAALSIFFFLAACTSTDPLTFVQDFEARHAIQNSGSNLDHSNLANQYADFAKEMQAKIEEISHKLNSSSFSKSAQRKKSRVAYKIRKYEQAAKESIEKADYHKKMAAQQTNRESAAKIMQPNRNRTKVQ